MKDKRVKLKRVYISGCVKLTRGQAKLRQPSSRGKGKKPRLMMLDPSPLSCRGAKTVKRVCIHTP